QAEDGIRDDLVTGVQTCALPIYEAGPLIDEDGARRGLGQGAETRLALAERFGRPLAVDGGRHVLGDEGEQVAVGLPVTQALGIEIGRASCREGGEDGELVGVVRR